MENDSNRITDDKEFLANLVVAIGEVSTVTGVPTRQIRYWEDKGIIESLTDGGKTRRYNYENIKKIILVKEMIDEGYTLEASAKRLEKRYNLVNQAIRQIGTQGS